MKSICLALLLVLCAAASAKAEDKAAAPEETQREEAKERFAAGTKLFEQARYAEAAEAFSEAYDALPDTRVLANIAVCLDKAGRLAEAAETYRRYLAAPVADPRNDQYRARLAELERLLPPPVVSAPPQPAPPLPTVEPPAVTGPRPVRPGAGFWVASALALGCGAGIVVSGVATLERKNEYEAADRLDEEAKHSGETTRLVANVLIGATAVSAATALIFLVTDIRKHRRGESAARLYPTDRGLAVEWSW